jgi:cell wall-associated NlpC family hydrolase
VSPRRALGTLLAAIVLALTLVPATSQALPLTTPTPRTAVGLPHASPDTAGQLARARHRAEQLRESLALVRARADWTNERLAYARDQLAAAASRSVTADEQEAELASAEVDAATALARRVRAIEQSGGTLALYAQALGGTSLTDIISNVSALNAVLGTDSAVEAEAVTAASEAATVHDHFTRIADDRAKLLRRVQALADKAERLVRAQRRLLRDADADVKKLARTLAEEREAAAAAAGAPDLPGATDAGENPYGPAAVAAALDKLGADYVWGAEGPSTFDCSGLVLWAYGQAGLVLPRLASDQYFASTPVAVSDMQPGDLLVYAYDPSDDNTIHHITMYIGDGKMVHAPRTGDVVRVVPVYYDGLYGVGRPGL